MQNLLQISNLMQGDNIRTQHENHINSASEVQSDEHKDDGSAGSGSSSIESESISDDDNIYTSGNYPGILDTDLTALTTHQRVIFISIVSVLFAMSLCGNFASLHVNFHRKIRPFFRTCLISLAISDLLSTFAMCLTYLSQFTEEYVQIWTLGSIMCSGVPFVSTAAILSSSLTLVGIALDRYFAVMKASNANWNPSTVFCFVCAAGVFITSFAIASPLIWVYNLYNVYILKIDNELGSGSSETTTTSWEASAANDDFSYTLVQEEQLVEMCISNQKEVALYYIVVFSIIFIPCIIFFIWLNSIIAKELWVRRHSATKHHHHHKHDCLDQQETNKKIQLLKTQQRELSVDEIESNPVISKQPPVSCRCSLPHVESTTMPSSSALAMGDRGFKRLFKSKDDPTTTSTSNKNNNKNNKTNTPVSLPHTNCARQRRHIRMFMIIIMMMAVFLFFRLPAWIFLILRLYGNYTTPTHWILYFSFGILNISSCAMNPIFYTFLAEAIHYVSYCKLMIVNECCGLRLLCCNKNDVSQTVAMNYVDSADELPEEQPNGRASCFTNWCCRHCGMLNASFKCSAPPRREQLHEMLARTNGSADTIVTANKQYKQTTSYEQDEGVECSDVSDISDSMNLYSQRIYTIFPASLVSSSVTSEAN